MRRLVAAGATAGSTEFLSLCERGSRVDVLVAFLAAPWACSVDTRDNMGRTALALASLRQIRELVSHLLRLGADPMSVDNEGNTVLDLVLRPLQRPVYHRRRIIPVAELLERQESEQQLIAQMLIAAGAVPRSSAAAAVPSPEQLPQCGQKRRRTSESLL